MSKEAYNKAWEHVVEYEKKLLNELGDVADREKHRAEACGCLQCIKHWQHTEDEWGAEYERQFKQPIEVIEDDRD